MSRARTKTITKLKKLALATASLVCASALITTVAATATVAQATTNTSSATAKAANSVSVFSYNGSRQESTVSVPLNPTRVVAIDFAALDIIDRLGAGQSVVGTPHGTAVPAYLKSYNDAKYKNIGTVKEVDMEAIMALEPQVIFIGGRLAAKYDELSKIAPVVFLAVDYNQPLLESVSRSAEVIGTIYNQKDQAKSIIASYQKRIQALKEASAGKTVVLGMVNASQFKTLGDHGRCAMISHDLGFTNLAKDVDSTHGNESSFELLLKLNPDYVFILDRDSAIGRPGAQLAKDVMNNDLVNKTKAAQSGHINYLNSAVWYLSEGGLTATDLMLQDLEQALHIAAPAKAK